VFGGSNISRRVSRDLPRSRKSYGLLQRTHERAFVIFRFPLDFATKELWYDVSVVLGIREARNYAPGRGISRSRQIFLHRLSLIS
jgi:hypothetical protein